MGIRRAAVSYLVKGVLNTIAKIDCKEYIEALEGRGPLLVIFNHVNFLEVPILVTHSYPLFVTGLVKKETWDNPLLGYLFTLFNAIPIDRNGAYAEAFKHAKEAINDGFHICIAPEGTRSKNGILGRGKPGVIQLALETNIPILPVAHHGGEKIWQNLRKFKRTPLEFKTGRPFKIKFEGRPGKNEREEILVEVMAQMAVLLPEELRGAYASHVGRDCKYLDFVL